MADSPSSNRGHRGSHRSRRGPDRRGSERTGDRSPEQSSDRGNERNGRGTERNTDRRPPSGPQPAAQTENADVAQIMRDIRSKVAQRHGINLTDQQIDELASRRLEAILDVRAASPDFMEQLQRSAGTPSVHVPAPPDVPGYAFEDYTLYETPHGLLRGIRRLLNPVLQLFFNPAPLVMALNLQSRLNTEAAAREAERTERQGEWNALHYALLKRLVTEIARLSLETQHLGQQVESLSAKVDFSDRRVRAIEGGVHQSEVRTAAAAPPPPRQELSRQDAPGMALSGGGGGDQAQGEGARRKRRRRRGRRPDGPDMQPEMQPGMAGAPGARPLPMPMDDGYRATDDGADGGTDGDSVTNNGADDGGYDGPDNTGPRDERAAPPMHVETAPAHMGLIHSEAAPPAVQAPQVVESGPAPSGTPEER